MIRTIYTALAGMNAYRSGLDAISNNVANLNTPGFKAGTPVFLDIVNRNVAGVIPDSTGSSSRGGGVAVDLSQVSAKQGELRSTGNSLDAALDGEGFFILEREGARYYTRSGQFEFDKEGYLVDRTTAARVLVTTDTDALTFLNIDQNRSFPPRATSKVSLRGNLARSATSPYELTGITVFDSAGGSRQLTAKFVRDATNPLLWTVEVRDGSTVLGSTTIEFNPDGTPTEKEPAFAIEIAPTGLEPFSVEIGFGGAGTFSGVTSLVNDTQSSLQVLSQDGVTYGSLTGVAFDEKGKVTLNYSNGEKLSPASLLIARFAGMEQLQSIGSGLHLARQGAEPLLGTAMTGGIGRLAGGQVELSNVELTEQFTDLIVIQRGYQASSQMGSVANEMLQQLLAMGQGR